MLKKSILIFCINLCGFLSYAQHSFGLMGFVNVSNRWSLAKENETHSFRHGCGFGTFYSYCFNDKSSVTVMFDYEICKFREHSIYTTQPTGLVHVSKYLTIALLNLPIYYQLKFGRLSLLFGAQFAFGSEAGGMRYVEYVEGSTDEVNGEGYIYRKIDLGPSLVILYQLSERFSLITSAYQGIMDNSASGNLHDHWTRFNFGFTYKPIKLFDGKSGRNKEKNKSD